MQARRVVGNLRVQVLVFEVTELPAHALLGG